MPIPWEHFSAGSLRDQAQAIPKWMPTTKAMLLFAAVVVEEQDKEQICAYTQDKEIWKTDCGRATTDKNPLKFPHCRWCGGKIVSK